VIDLLFIETAADGVVRSREVSELAGNEAHDGFADPLAGLPTCGNVEWLAEEIAAGTTAVVVVYEPRGATEATERAGGVFLGKVWCYPLQECGSPQTPTGPQHNATRPLVLHPHEVSNGYVPARSSRPLGRH
jgi:hypothetical protein